MVQTKKCVLIGTYKENMYPSVCVEAIEKLGNLIKSCLLINCTFYTKFLLFFKLIKGDYFNQKNSWNNFSN